MLWTPYSLFPLRLRSELDGFIAGRIGFLEMASLVERVLGQLVGHPELANATIDLDNVAHADHLARKAVDALIAQRA